MEEHSKMLLTTPNNNLSSINSSIDVILKGCFLNYDSTACVRNSVLCGVALVTFAQCILRVGRLHWLHHPQLHQYLIFYLATAETCLLGIKWLMGSHLPQLEFIAIYLKLIQFIILCHFHWTLATRILHRERLVSWIILPLLGLFAIYFTLVTILGIINTKSSWLECMAPHWLMLSVAECLVVQLFAVAGISITQKINTVSALESFKWEQKRDLWSVIVVYEVSALTSVSYDFTIKLIGNEANGCSGIYHHMQAVYSPILAIYSLVRFLLPIWAMIVVYQPIKGRSLGDEEGLLNWTVDASGGCTFGTPATREQHIYNQLLQPGCDPGILGCSPPLVPTYTSIGRNASNLTQAFVTGILRRSILTPITEEEVIAGQSTSYPEQEDITYQGYKTILHPESV